MNQPIIISSLSNEISSKIVKATRVYKKWKKYFAIYKESPCTSDCHQISSSSRFQNAYRNSATVRKLPNFHAETSFKKIDYYLSKRSTVSTILLDDYPSLPLNSRFYHFKCGCIFRLIPIWFSFVSTYCMAVWTVGAQFYPMKHSRPPGRQMVSLFPDSLLSSCSSADVTPMYFQMLHFPSENFGRRKKTNFTIYYFNWNVSLALNLRLYFWHCIIIDHIEWFAWSMGNIFKMMILQQCFNFWIFSINLAFKFDRRIEFPANYSNIWHTLMNRSVRTA